MRSTNQSQTWGRATALCVVLVLAQLVASAGIAFADLNHPDTLAVKSVNVYRHLLEPNDQLFIIHYDCHYGNATGQPSQDISDTFAFQLLRANDTAMLANTTAYPYHNSGYDEGMASIYLASGVAAAWEGTHSVKMLGSSLFDSPPSDTLVLSSSDYVSATAPSAIRAQLALDLLDLAELLELDWDSDGELQQYTYGGQVLTEQGEWYFTQSIDNLERICPAVFYVQSQDPTLKKKEFDRAQDAANRAQWQDTEVGSFQEALSELFGGLAAIWITGIVTIGLMAGVIILGVRKQYPASAGLLIALPILFGSTDMGFFSYVVLGVVTFACIWLLGQQIWGKRASG